MAPVGVDDDQLEVLRREADEPVFRSGAAREDFERARRLRNVKRVALAVLLLGGGSLAMYRMGKGRSGAGGEDAEAGASCCARLDIPPVGSPEAKVKVECIVPADSDCHAPIIRFLSETAGRNVDRIRVDFRSMHDYNEEELKNMVGAFCAAVVINGETSFEYTHDGRKVRTSLVGTVPTHYGLTDVGEALAQVYEQHYGKPQQPVYEIPEELQGEATGLEAPSEETREQGKLDVELPALPEIKYRKE